DLTLRSLRSGAHDTELIALSETVGVRLLLVNVLRSLGTGQRMSAEGFDKLLDEIGATKHDLATKLIAERRRGRMPKTVWGRKETIIWPRHLPIYTYAV